MATAALLLTACRSEDATTHAPERIDIAPADVHVVATAEALARVADVQPASDGRVWMLNSVAPYFIVVAPDGEVERVFGQQGGGPDEFGAPVKLVRGPGGEIWTYDVPRNALRRISTGEPQDLRFSSDSLPLTSIVSFEDAGARPVPPWLQSVGGGFLVGRKRPGTPPSGAVGLWHADIFRVRLDPEGFSMEPYMPVADFLGDPASRYANATTVLPYPIWAVCGDGTLGLYDPLMNALRRFGPTGTEGDTLALPPERRQAVTSDGVLQMVFRELWERQPPAQRPDSARMRQILETQFEQAKNTFADVFPEYADVRCTSGDTFWLQPFDVASGRFGRGPGWLRIAGDGSRTHVTFPEEFTPFRFEGDRVWGAMVDTLGVASLAWVGLVGPL